MKLLSISVNYPHTDGFSYQENLLPLYQQKCGYEVCILASEYCYNGNGVIGIFPKNEYIDNNGIHIKRLKIKKGRGLTYRFKRFEGFYQSLEEIKPDIIFCHLFQFCDVKKLITYKKEHKECRIFVDSHADFNNSASSWLSKNILHKIIWRHYAKKICPYVEKFYGVTPARVDFLRDIYKLPSNKIELLPLGADDDAVEKALKEEVCLQKRLEYGLSDDDFVIVSGGKIDYNKPQTLLLMKAVNHHTDLKVKLLVFGSVAEEYKEEFTKQLSDRVHYIGWKKAEDIYSEFAIADLIAFPGLHSVLWEQAVGMGKPCIFRNIQGFHHIDLGGNCLFFEEDSVESYNKTISDAIASIEDMKSVARKKGKEEFSYMQIAQRSIQRDTTL